MKGKKPVIAYHFTGDRLRDGSPIPSIGKWLTYSGPDMLRYFARMQALSVIHLWDAPDGAVRVQGENLLHVWHDNEAKR